MLEKEKIIKSIFLAVEEVAEQLPDNRRLEKNLDIILYGQNGMLDSLELVNLIMAVENKISEEFGINITLADEKAMSQENSPFRTLSSLYNYICLILNEKINV